MAILGPYTGDVTKKSISYLYGDHWKGMKGYKVVQGKSKYNHRFGGQTWKLPKCKNCNELYHQIFTFDLTDPKLSKLQIDELEELPLISCLNCSTVWQTQLFKINKNKLIEILNDIDDQEWIQNSIYKIASPLPEIGVCLQEMTNKDIPLNCKSYYDIVDTFGEEYICRLLGAPLYINSPIDRECPICKREMQFIASIGSQQYGEVGNVMNNVDFFIGEMNLYFLFCKECMVMKTECQSM